MESKSSLIKEHKRLVKVLKTGKGLKAEAVKQERELKNMTKTPKTFAGKSTKLGGGGKFAMLTSKLEKKGKSKESAKTIAASIGIKKYGKGKMMAMAAKGKKK
jgi:hypothetical protein